MNKLILCLLFAFSSTGAFSQKLYFIYFQSESSQAFYVKVNNKVYSSSTTGYAIVSRLVDSTYNISVGFPGGSISEQEFKVALNRKDRGFLIKNFGEKGWGLFDLQNMSIVSSASAKSAHLEKQTIPASEVSLFATILSQAADDPSLLEKPIRPAVKKEEVIVNSGPVPNNSTAQTKKDETAVQTAAIKTEEVKIPVTDVAAIKKNETPEEPAKTVTTEIPPEKKEEAVVETKLKKEYERSQVTKTSGIENEEGFDIVYVDVNEDGKTDTIRLQIPNPKNFAAQSKVVPEVTAKEEKKFLDINTDTVKTAVQPKDSAKVDEKKTDSVKTESLDSKAQYVAPVTEAPKTETRPVTKEPAKQPITNTCSAVADESDFIKLRRKMVAGKDDDEMVMEAKKYFKTKCFTVYQVRNLSTLFLTDEGKYNFFDAAYRNTSDVHNFISLQLELKEEYYINRFKAMLR